MKSYFCLFGFFFFSMGIFKLKQLGSIKCSLQIQKFKISKKKKKRICEAAGIPEHC